MPVPSKNFTILPDGDCDPDSPVTTNLVVALRDNDIHLEEWLGFSYTAAQNHDHNGTNSKQIAYADITGTPASTGVSASTFSSTVNVNGGGGDVVYDTGALGFTPKSLTILTGSALQTGPFPLENWDGMATGTGSMAAMKDGLFAPVTGVVARYSTYDVTVTQFTSAGVKLTFEDALFGTDLEYQFVMQVIGT